MFLLVVTAYMGEVVFAAEKTWSGGGDGETWSDEDNWFPVSVPATQDDVVIDAENADVKCKSTFKAKSVTIGSRETSNLTIENFIFGTIAPASGSDTAISNNKEGKIILEGAAGKLSLKGKYLDSQQSLAFDEPSFIFWVK